MYICIYRLTVVVWMSLAPRTACVVLVAVTVIRHGSLGQGAVSDGQVGFSIMMFDESGRYVLATCLVYMARTQVLTHVAPMQAKMRSQPALFTPWDEEYN